MIRITIKHTELLLNGPNEVATLLYLCQQSIDNKCDPRVGSDEEDAHTLKLEVDN